MSTNENITITIDDLSGKQKEVVQWLTRDILEYDSHCGCYHQALEKYEYKQFELTRAPGSKLVFLYAIVGMKNDENTMARVLCRTRRHIVIGPCGSTHLLNPRNNNRNIRGYTRCLWTPTT